MKYVSLQAQSGAAKSRSVITLFLIIAGVALLVGFYVLQRQFTLGAVGHVRQAPDIQSLPGSPQATEKYVSLQEHENKVKAIQAEKDGGSNVPTLVRASFKNVDTQAAGASGACSVDNLRKAREAGVSAFELRCRGCDAAALKAAGYTAAELRAAGFTAAQLRAAGFTAQELRDAGFSAKELRDAGFSAAELKSAGYTCKEMAMAAVPKADAVQAGCDAATYADKQAQCDVDYLKQQKEKGVSARVLREKGCSAAALKAAGFSAKELRDAGFSAAELKSAGFTAGQLKDAGFSAKDLRDAGFDAKALKDAGFTAAELKDAGFTNGDLTRAGFSNTAVHGSGGGCSIEEIQKQRALGVSAKEMKERGCSLAALKAAGYTAKELKDAGFSAAQLRAAGFSAKDLKDAGFSAADLKAAGFSAKDLKDAGFNAADLKAAGFSAKDLRDAGFDAKALKDAGFSAKDLKDAGFDAKALKDAGFSPSALREAGFSAKDLKDAGFGVNALSAAGFKPSELAGAGFSDQALKNAGMSDADIQAAKALLLKDQNGSGCDLKTLREGRAHGVLASVYKKRGCSAAALKAAGYTAKELKDAGFSAAELRAAGFSAKDLKDAGFSAKDLKDAGFSTQELKDAGFDDDALKKAGIIADQSPQNDPSGAIGSGLEKQISAGLSGEKTSMTDSERRLAALREQQERLMSEQQKKQEMMQIRSAMGSQAKTLLGVWSRAQKHAFVSGQADGQGDGGSANMGSASGTDQGLVPSGQIITAGSIEFGVLETSINSDNKGPILASIVHGPLKGTRLLGAFTRQNDQVMLRFTRASLPGVSKSVTVSIYAIDQDTARTGMASSVNHHYWLRYGGLFASSFASGIGTALNTSGTTVEGLGNTAASSANGSWAITSANLSPFGQTLVALGDVGTQFSTALAPLVNTPPTVYLDSGTGLGLLFMNDFSIPVRDH